MEAVSDDAHKDDGDNGDCDRHTDRFFFQQTFLLSVLSFRTMVLGCFPKNKFYRQRRFRRDGLPRNLGDQQRDRCLRDFRPERPDGCQFTPRHDWEWDAIETDDGQLFRNENAKTMALPKQMISGSVLPANGGSGLKRRRSHQ